ncbi:MAG TPA: radical SAM protein [Candidatus Dormibacteraeota bacterium]|nr:radical SAM protein [Candidatus Dormibacteraeota bacterium]
MGTAARASTRFTLILIKPSHYDDDGYVIQWLRSAIPSNTLAVMNGLALDCKERRVLGDDVEIVIKALDETNTHIRPRKIARQLQNERCLVALIGVQSNQFPRALDIARPLRAAGIPVCIGGFHVSGCLAMLPGIPAELQQAMDLGISLFAGEAEGRFEEVLVDAWQGKLRPLYNYMADLPSLDGVPLPILPATRIKRTGGRITTFDAGRGCPFLCSFCTIINVQGRKSRRRSVDDIEQIVRRNLEQGINRFFITDDNFARNTDWEKVFDRLIAMREGEKLNLKFVIQVDTMCHRLPHFIEKAGRAGVARVFIGLESINPDALQGARKKQNKVAEYRKMLLEWKAAGVTVFAGYIVGFPSDTPESVMRDIETIQRELPIDLLEPHCLTPLPGSEDHQTLHKAGAYLDPDLNKYDLEHVTAAHSTMTPEQWQKLYHDAWMAYYSPQHLETVMRRAVATDCNAGNMTFLLLWYYSCVRLEKIDPLEGGYLRRKYRKERRPTLPVESPFVFYPRYLADLVKKHVTLAGLIWRYGKLRRQLKRDPEARHYMDLALTPVADYESEDAYVTSGHHHANAKPALVTLGNPADVVAQH